MNILKQIFRSPYFYIFTITYYGIWLLWDHLFVPYYNPSQVIGALSVLHYNPLSNIFRFCAAILLPPFLCLLYWLAISRVPFEKTHDFLTGKRSQRLVSIILVCGSLFILAGAAIIQSSTSGSNDSSTYGGPYSNTLVDTFHEGETLGSAESYSQKDLKPYKNIVFVHGVFQDPVRSILAFKIFGRSIGAERAFSSILTIITFLLFYVLLLVLFKGNLAKSGISSALLGLLLLPVIGNTLPFLSKYVVSIQLPSLDFETILFLLFAVLGLEALIGKRPKLTIMYTSLVGFVTVAGFANAIDRALFLAVLAIVWLVMSAALVPRKRFSKMVVLPFTGGSLVGLAVLGVALKGDFIDFIKFLLHISQYKEYLDGYAFYRPSIAEGIILVIVSGFLTVFGAKFLESVAHADSRRTAKENIFKRYKPVVANFVAQYYVTILLLCTAIFFLRSAIGRADYGHFAYSILWTYLLLAYIGFNYLFSNTKIHKPLCFLAVLLVSFTTIYYGLLVKAVDMPKNTFPIHVSDQDLTRTDYLQTAAYLKKNLHGHETFMTLTSEGFWYYLVNKPAPVKYPIVWFAGAKDQRTALAQSLASNPNIKFVLTNNNWTSDIDYVPTRDRLPEVYQVLETQYVPYKGIGQQTLWKRK